MFEKLSKEQKDRIILSSNPALKLVQFDNSDSIFRFYVCDGNVNEIFLKNIQK